MSSQAQCCASKNGDVKISDNCGQVVKFSSLDKKIQSLLMEAVEARTKAYCPFSKFPVGSAVLAETGRTYRGCNVENAAFTVGVCAERVAICSAIASGDRRFTDVAVVALQAEGFTSPCGACRQFMSEFGSDVNVYMSRPQLDEVLVTTVEKLLPAMFVITDRAAIKLAA